MKKIMGLMVLSMSLASCASVEVQDLNFEPKVMHFDTPETVGSLGGGSLVLHGESETPSYLLGSATNTISSGFGAGSLAIDATQKSSAYSSNYGVRGDLGLLENVDLFYAGDGMFGIKMQLWGASQLRKEEGFKLAISAAAGSYNTYNGVSAWDFFNLFTASDLSSEAAISIKDVSVNMGYRFNKKGIIYVNTFLQQSSLKGDIYKASNENVSIYSTQGESESKGVFIGLRLHKEVGVMVTLEVGAVQSTWSGLDTLTSYPVGASTGFSW